MTLRGGWKAVNTNKHSCIDGNYSSKLCDTFSFVATNFSTPIMIGYTLKRERVL